MTLKQMRAVRRAADGDADWFTGHPERSYRVRPATPAEVAMQRAAREMEPIPPGLKVYACIWQIEPHTRCTALVLGAPSNDADNASEAKAAALFELAVSRGSTLH